MTRKRKEQVTYHKGQIPNRTYKSTIFIRLLEDKGKLLQVYNALNGTHYTDPDLLEINTLENAIYMAMKNDVSFLIDSRLISVRASVDLQPESAAADAFVSGGPLCWDDGG